MLKANSQSIDFGPWHISYEVSRILPSVCSTKVVCDRDDGQFCEYCRYCKELVIPHFPDMVFPKNILSLNHKGGSKIVFSPLDALKGVANTVEAIEVACAGAWQESRPDAEKLKKTFDWTFSTDYKGTLSDNIIVESTNENINIELLKQRDQILFYHDLTLFEDELHDHGISKLSVKIIGRDRDPCIWWAANWQRAPLAGRREMARGSRKARRSMIKANLTQAFADDVVLMFFGQSTSSVEEDANQGLAHINCWGVKNKMRFMPSKTNSMVVIRKLNYDGPVVHMNA
ncbi:TIP41-like protein [Eumeta japonica]|uniref:TIP41-like protein n=1 Tax=Eumeta variegata TaxID=151549 RepID=A0A4C1SYA1_EUMVA|nr:TIP41-like protein [Eumeta japonica]